MATFMLLAGSWIFFEFSSLKSLDWSPLPDSSGANLPGLLLNRLALSMGCLVAFLSLIVNRYATRYLASDRAERGFFVWSHPTITAVLVMILTNNFIIFWLAWLATSLGLHQLLTLYKEKPAARRTAALKFGISRIGDVALLGAAFLMWQEYQSFHFPTVLQAAATGHSSHGIGILIAIGALTKSAVAPFHAWLPETIDTPTPVSALMHAGIINAGGYLVLRTLPLVTTNSWALALLCLFGILSIAVAGLTMLSTPDVKRQLALSTTAQMGFMFVQIGFGLPAVALAHMMAHAFYKAYAFLSSGELAKLRQQPWQWSWGSHPLTFGIVGLSLTALFMATLHHGWSVQEASLLALSVLLLGSSVSFLCALTHHKIQRVFFCLLLPLGTAGLLKLSHEFGTALLQAPAAYFRAANGFVLILVVLAAQGLFILQRTLPIWKSPAKFIFLTHARHGFYIHSFGHSVMRKLGYV